MKVDKLNGPGLDLWVAKAEGVELWVNIDAPMPFSFKSRDGVTKTWSPSTDWEHGGPIIERNRIGAYFEGGQWWAGMKFEDDADSPGIYCDHGHLGETILIAAMRCYVASVFGEEVSDAG